MKLPVKHTDLYADLHKENCLRVASSPEEAPSSRPEMLKRSAGALYLPHCRYVGF